MPASLNTRQAHYCLLLLLGAWMFLTNLGGPTLWDVDEGRNATATLEMIESGNYIVPTFNGQLRAHKPILLYWLQAAAYHAFGVSEFSARLPSALAALLVLALTYELCRAMFGTATGVLAGVVVATTPMLIGAARFANPDALLTAFVALTLTIFWLGYEKPRGWWFAALGVSSGLAVLTKGPIGLLLPGAISFLYLLWERKLRLVLRWQLGWAVLAWALVALPWYIWAALETKSDFIRGFLMNHNVNRFLEPMENHSGSILYYPLVLLAGLAPWSVFIGLTFWHGGWAAVREPRPRYQETWLKAAGQEKVTPAYRFLLVWFGVYLAFFSLAATKLPNYVLPAVIPCAALTARFLERWRRGDVAPPIWIIHTALALLVLIGVGTSAGMLIASGKWRLFVLSDRAIAGLDSWWLIGIVPVITASLIWWLMRRESRSAKAANFRTGMVAVLALGITVFLGPLAAWATATFNRHKAPQYLATGAGFPQGNRDLRIGTYQVDYLPSLNFYAQRDITHFFGDDDAIAFLRYPIPTYLFVPAQTWERIAERAPSGWREIARHADMYRHQTVILICNCDHID